MSPHKQNMKIPPLKTPVDWKRWKYQMRHLLTRLEVQDVVTGEVTRLNDHDNYTRKNAEAIVQISVTLDNEYHELIYEKEDAVEVWRTLCSHFERKGADVILYLNRKIMGEQMTKTDTVDSYCTRIKSLYDDLKIAGQTIDPLTIVVTILGGLRSEFQNIKSVLQAQHVSDLTFDKIVAQLRTTELDLGTNPQRSKGNPKTTINPTNELLAVTQPNVTCWQCKQKGHYSTQCPYHKSRTQHNQQTQNNGQYRSNSRPDTRYRPRTNTRPPETVNALIEETENQPVESSEEQDKQEFLLTLVSGNDTAENIENNMQTDQTQWIVDSGATAHMCNDNRLLHDYCQYQKPVLVQLGKKNNFVVAYGEGKISLQSNIKYNNSISVTLERVVYSPTLRSNFFSVPTAEKKGCSVLFTEGGVKIFNQNSKSILYGSRINNLYILQLQMFDSVNALTVENSDPQIWHRRLGHVGLYTLKSLLNVNGFTCLQNVDFSKKYTQQCGPCVVGKLTNKSHDGNIEQTFSNPGQIAHMDVVGPINPSTFSQYRFSLTIVDEKTRYTTTYLLKEKSDVFVQIQIYHEFLRVQLKYQLEIIHCDKGTEFNNIQVLNFCSQHGIQVHFTSRYSPQSNGIAERCNRTLFNTVRSLLADAQLPKGYWGEALVYSTLIKNCVTSKDGISAYEQFLGKIPNLEKIKVFGCLAFCRVPDEMRKKLDSKAAPCIFLGLPTSSDGYKLLLKEKNSIITERTVNFWEEIPGYTYKTVLPPVVRNTIQQQSSSIVAQSDIQSNDTVHTDDVEFNEISSENPASPGSSITFDKTFSNENSVDQPDNIRRSTRQTDTPIRLRHEYVMSANEVSNKNSENFFENQLLMAETENWSAYPTELIHESEVLIPTNLQDALTGQFSYYWTAAIKDEFLSLSQNLTWETCDFSVQQENSSNAVGSKYVFRPKCDSEGNVFRFKARIVAQGFTQKEQIDFSETFAPVPHIETVRTVIALMHMHKMHVHQCDVDTAFLYADLKETIFLKTPKGYVGRLGPVVLLKKTIYGLKQSPLEWNEHIKGSMCSLNFQQSKVDQCLYVKIKNSELTNIILIWVDDIINGGLSLDVVKQFTSEIKQFYRIKDLGRLELFLGIKFHYNEYGNLLISQENYINKILQKFGLLDCNAAVLPAVPNESVNPDPESELCDNKVYRSIVGALLFLARMTRPDICWIVNQLARYQTQATIYHLSLAKKVLRYLQGTKTFCLKYSRGNPLDMHVFCDVSYGCNPTDGKSTSAFIITVGNCIVGWGTKKQSVVALSTTESELISMCRAVQEGLFIYHLLQDLMIQGKIQVFSDNEGSISIALKNQTNKNTKHIATKNYFLKDLVSTGLICIHYLQSQDMPADIMTKQLPKEKLAKHLGTLKISAQK